MPVPTAAAQRLLDAQQRSDELDALVDDKFRSLGEPGIARPRDTLLFVNDLVYKEKSKGSQLTCACLFCNMRIISTGATRVVDHLISCPRVLIKSNIQ